MIPEGFHLPMFVNPVQLTHKSHRPWPPIYRQQPARNSFCFRPPEPAQWREKGRDYYYLAPLYRNALPPPPRPVDLPPPRRMMLVDPQTRGCPPDCPCLHRSRSLEDVRSVASDWSDDERPGSGERHPRRVSHAGPPKAPRVPHMGKPLTGKPRRAFDDASHLDNRRKGSFQASFLLIHSVSVQSSILRFSRILLIIASFSRVLGDLAQ